MPGDRALALVGAGFPGATIAIVRVIVAVVLLTVGTDENPARCGAILNAIAQGDRGVAQGTGFKRLDTGHGEDQHKP